MQAILKVVLQRAWSNHVICFLPFLIFFTYDAALLQFCFLRAPIAQNTLTLFSNQSAVCDLVSEGGRVRSAVPQKADAQMLLLIRRRITEAHQAPLGDLQCRHTNTTAVHTGAYRMYTLSSLFLALRMPRSEECSARAMPV